MIFLLVILIFAVIGVITAMSRQQAVQTQMSRVRELGVVSGRTRAEIVSKLGAPNSVSAISSNSEVLQWISGIGGRQTYHIAMLFENGLCMGITHERVSRY